MSDSTDPIEAALAAVIQGAASPAVQEAQALMLRRLALEASVLPSRLQRPPTSPRWAAISTCWPPPD